MEDRTANWYVDEYRIMWSFGNEWGPDATRLG